MSVKLWKWDIIIFLVLISKRSIQPFDDHRPPPTKCQVLQILDNIDLHGNKDQEVTDYPLSHIFLGLKSRLFLQSPADIERYSQLSIPYLLECKAYPGR